MEARQYILLPRRGLRTGGGPIRSMLTALPQVRSTEAPAIASLPAAPEFEIRVLDSVHNDGPMLVELDDQSRSLTNTAESLLRAVPLAIYQQPNPGLAVTRSVHETLIRFRVLVEDAQTDAPVRGVEIIAFDNFLAKTGSRGLTDDNGYASMAISGSTIDRLYAFASSGHWGAFAQNRTITDGETLTIAVEPIDLTYTDAVRHHYGSSTFYAESGVKVGIIDTGIGPHNDLNVVEGHNTVTGELASDWNDTSGHGTHVAGLVGSNGVPPTGLRGVAPGVNLIAFRVFGQNPSNGATNYAILKALMYAADAGCDIVNLSLGGGPWDEIVEEGIADARNQGILVIAAAGNDGRRPVNFPAAHLGAIAVSAMGIEDMFPAGSLDEGEVHRPPYARNPKEFIAGFSNVGTKVDLTAPGVGLLSTLPGNSFGPMSGTSMAAPVAAGAAACLLSRHPSILAMPRNRTRSDAMERLILSRCSRRGFGIVCEGYGMPDPTQV